MNFQPLSRSGSRDEIDDHLMTDQGLAAPIHADVREQAMLNLVSLTGTWWQMRNMNWNVDLVGQLL